MRLSFVLSFYFVVYNVAGAKWYNIVNLREEPDGGYLAVDVDNDIVFCPGAKLIVCPRNEGRTTQQWKWQGRMLINKVNKLAIDVKNDAVNNNPPLIAFYPTNSTNQRWFRDGKFLVSEFNRNVMGLDPNQIKSNETSLVGIRLRLFNKKEQDSLNFQMVEAK